MLQEHAGLGTIRAVAHGNQVYKGMVENGQLCMALDLHQDPGDPVLALLQDFGRSSLRESHIPKKVLRRKLRITLVYPRGKSRVLRFWQPRRFRPFKSNMVQPQRNVAPVRNHSNIVGSNPMVRVSVVRVVKIRRVILVSG